MIEEAERKKESKRVSRARQEVRADAILDAASELIQRWGRGLDPSLCVHVSYAPSRDGSACRGSRAT